MGYFTDCKFDSIYDMIDCVNEVVERNVREQFEVTSADKLGLDIRAGYRIFVNEEFIAVEGDGHMLDYYGGFEYVDKECVQVLGEFKFYSADDSRVRGCIEEFYEAQAEVDSVED